MKTRCSFLAAATLLLPLAARAQSVGIGTTTPHSAAALDITATDKGLLIPRMDSATRAGIATPPDGLMVFQTDGRPGFWYAMRGTWLYIPDKTRTGDNLGNHAATRNLNLAGFRLVGGSAATPGTVGLRIDGNGLVRLTSSLRPFNSYNNGVGLHISEADAGFLVRTTIGYGDAAPPQSGFGDRLMWTSYYGAFRAGGVDAGQWDSNNMGFYSAPLGFNNTAAGLYSFATGYNNAVRGNYGTALGRNNAVNVLSMASLAFGRECRVKGDYNVAGGYLNKVEGRAAIALGERCTANADYAVCLGYRSSANRKVGSFTIADQSRNDSLRASANHLFSARYAGGYRLFTNAAMTVGVSLAANGGNAWQVISDSTKKERRCLADGNQFLERINRMPLG